MQEYLKKMLILYNSILLVLSFYFIFHKWNMSTVIQWIATIKYIIISEIFIWQEFIMLYILFYYC